MADQLHFLWNGEWQMGLMFNVTYIPGKVPYSFILSHSILELNHCINYYPKIKYEEGECRQFQWLSFYDTIQLLSSIAGTQGEIWNEYEWLFIKSQPFSLSHIKCITELSRSFLPKRSRWFRFCNEQQNNAMTTLVPWYFRGLWILDWLMVS